MKLMISEIVVWLKKLMGIGISSFTEVVGAGPSKDFDILGIKMFDSSEIRIHPTGKAIAMAIVFG